ncbi:MAG TPA: polyketide synthase dehydratase domain-containing protein, partial [Terriglobales bacterium]|nr:polyketide synthase dehydratase domain-containing protein [Terriglobales bacterium]
EFDPTGGLDTDKMRAALESSQAARGPMLGRVASLTLHGGLSIETTLDPGIQPFLRDHQIEGTPLLPGVMGIEAFAEAAHCLFPAWHIEAVENVNFLVPLKFYRNQPRMLTIEALIRPLGAGLIADCRLSGRRKVPNLPEPQVTTHFTGRVRLARQSLPAITKPRLGSPAGPMITADDIYRVYFHGPAYQVVERAWWDGVRLIAQLAANLPANHHPPELNTAISPRLIEFCFQSAGLWELGVLGQLGLPQYVEQVRLLRAPELADGPLYSIIAPHSQPSHFDVEVLDAAGNVYLQLTGYRTVVLPEGVDANAVKALQALMSLQSVAA